MSKISVVINTRNEEENLPRAVASVKGFADEVVVCDMESADDTVKVAKGLGVKLYAHKYLGYVEPVRNFAISKAINDWILVLDPDEEVSTSLAKKLKELVKNPTADYYRIPRKNIIFGKWVRHSRWWPDYNIRFFKKDCVSWSEVIHGVPMTQGLGGELADKEEYAIVHHHYDSVEQYIERLNRYTSVQADIKNKDGYKFNYLDFVRKPVGEFLSRFFAGEGYKDGVHGFALALLQSFSELVLYLKFWQKSGFNDERVEVKTIKEEFGKVKKDLNYWFADVNYKENKNILDLLKRKFKIS